MCDAAGGNSLESVQTWNIYRQAFGSVVRAKLYTEEVIGVNPAAVGPEYTTTAGTSIKATLVLKNIRGELMYLNGATAGFQGEGSRASHVILTQAGFSIDIKRLYDPAAKAGISLSRDVAG